MLTWEYAMMVFSTGRNVEKSDRFFKSLEIISVYLEIIYLYIYTPDMLGLESVEGLFNGWEILLLFCGKPD